MEFRGVHQIVQIYIALSSSSPQAARVAGRKGTEYCVFPGEPVEFSSFMNEIQVMGRIPIDKKSPYPEDLPIQMMMVGHPLICVKFAGFRENYHE
ncbi:hypothetical protein [Methanovulcanius yangii]|uniref:hypothetical protein n=1 Tax=Methanovulcanius yangii TaxID=1789227 RepID=UPI0029CA3E0D|nr:hypothetical protein [Methanovulcanius yangii]